MRLTRVVAVALATPLLLGASAATAARPEADRLDVPASLPSGADALLGDRVLVRFRPAVSLTSRAAALRGVGGIAEGAPDAGGVQAVRTTSPAAAVLALRERSDVVWAEREVRYSRLGETSATPERQEAGFDTAYTVSGGAMRGAGVSIAIVDDGVDPLNPDLSLPGKVLDGGDFTGESGATGLTPSGHHGTAVAAIVAATGDNGVGIVGGAPDATIRSYRVFSRTDESAGSAAVRAAVLAAVADGVSVINLSIGSPFRSEAVTDAIESARSADVVVVAATGNDGTERPTFPAANHGVISVGASQQTSPGVWTVAPFSNGGAVDVIAPGVGVTTWVDDTSGVPALGQVTGTSFAAPQVSAIAAGLAAAGVRGDRARAAIVASAEPRAGGVPARSGAGRADAATSYTLSTGATPYDAVFVADGHTIATAVGHRDVEALRWDPVTGNADDGPPTVSATIGTVGPANIAARDIGSGRLHTVVVPYDAPRTGVDVATNAEDPGRPLRRRRRAAARPPGRADERPGGAARDERRDAVGDAAPRHLVELHPLDGAPVVTEGGPHVHYAGRQPSGAAVRVGAAGVRRVGQRP